MDVERPTDTMPAELDRRARAVALGDTEWQVPPAVDAATVLLLRDAAGGIEVFLQRRVSRMAFAAGMVVFPGGRVEPADADLPWQVSDHPEPAFAVPDDAPVTATARALTTAAARETWEEAGTFLAVDAAGPVTSAPPDPDADFGDWLRDHDLAVDGSAFGAWSHWITPEVEPRRFDTRFLVAELPAGQQARDRGIESDSSWWFRPAAALSQVRDGWLRMLPPTSHALAELTSFDSVAAVLREARTRRPRPWLPRPVAAAGDTVQWRLVDAYTGGEVAT